MRKQNMIAALQRSWLSLSRRAYTRCVATKKLDGSSERAVRSFKGLNGFTMLVQRDIQGCVTLGQSRRPTTVSTSLTNPPIFFHIELSSVSTLLLPVKMFVSRQHDRYARIGPKQILVFAQFWAVVQYQPRRWVENAPFFSEYDGPDDLFFSLAN
jgi:hypothetical protein